MADKKQDVRVTKTQRSLVLALFALLQNQSFSKITINDICGEAMVSRSTFYAHFEDKYALLQFCMQEMDRRIFAISQDVDLHELLVGVLQRMQQNAKTLRNLMIAELDIELIEMFRRHFIDIFRRMLHQRGLEDEIPASRVEVVASFYAAGVSQTIALWISGKLPLDIEEMADALFVLLDGLRQEPKE